MKTNKSFSKRIKKTKSGKLLSQKIGRGHFNAKERNKQKSAKKRMVVVQMTKKSMGRFIK